MSICGPRNGRHPQFGPLVRKLQSDHWLRLLLCTQALALSSPSNLGEGLVLHRNFIKTVDARRCLLICAPQTDRAESYRHQLSHRVKRPHSVAKPVRVRTSDVTRGRCLKPNDKTVDRATGWNRFQADASLALVVFQMVTLIAEGTSRASASEVELAEGAARSVSPCWAQALITVLRPAVGEARSPRSQTF